MWLSPRSEGSHPNLRVLSGVVLLSALLAACGSAGADIYAAARSTDGIVIRLDVRTCNAELTATVDENAERVVVTVTAKGDYEAGDCSDILLIELAVPLGTRTLIDGSDNTPIEVRVKPSLDE